MDVGFGPDERILWPASVLAGVAMCGAVSHHLSIDPRLLYLLVIPMSDYVPTVKKKFSLDDRFSVPEKHNF